jgi:hypothetical protein
VPKKQPKNPQHFTTKDGKVRQPGRLTEADKLYIKHNALKQSDEDIADHLGKNPNTIREYRRYELGIDPDIAPQEKEYYKIRGQLRKSTEYEFIKDQFSEKELDFFEKKYAELVCQFNNDVYETEKQQIIQSIEVLLFMKRLKNEQNSIKKHQKILYKTIEIEIQKDKEQQDTKVVAALESEIGNMRSALSKQLEQYNLMLQRHRDLMKDLKSTRDQRLKQIESQGKNFIGLVKMLEDNKRRDVEARHMELVRLAELKELDRLSQPHTYFNKEVDLPILNPETVARYTEKELERDQQQEQEDLAAEEVDDQTDNS